MANLTNPLWLSDLCTRAGCRGAAIPFVIAKEEGDSFACIYMCPDCGHQWVTYYGHQRRFADPSLGARLRRYSLSWPEFWLLAIQSHGKCLACGTWRPSSLVIDHDHATGRVRGLLCQPCNARDALA